MAQLMPRCDWYPGSFHDGLLGRGGQTERQVRVARPVRHRRVACDDADESCEGAKSRCARQPENQGPKASAEATTLYDGTKGAGRQPVAELLS